VFCHPRHTRPPAVPTTSEWRRQGEPSGCHGPTQCLVEKTNISMAQASKPIYVSCMYVYWAESQTVRSLIVLGARAEPPRAIHANCDSRFTILPQTAVPPATPHSPRRPPPGLKGTCRLQSAPPSGFQPSSLPVFDSVCNTWTSKPGSTQHASR
jgi:hypothetical protein